MKFISIILGSLMLASCAHQQVQGKAFCPGFGVVDFTKDPKIEGSWVELYVEGRRIKLNNCVAIFYGKEEKE